MKTYLEKLKDPRWQKKRLKIFERDEWTCQICYNVESTLNIHRRYYLNDNNPWDYPDDSFVSLCESCHNTEKENRPEQEKRLLHSFKKHFFTEGIDFLAIYFDNARFFHINEFVIDVIGWVLYDEAIQKELIDRYFKRLRKTP